MLTSKQEKYVNNLVKGMSQRIAYRNAYPSSKKWKDETVDSKASTLLKNEKVKERYKKLIDKVNNKLEERTIMNALERMKWLTDVINGDILEDVPLMTKATKDKVDTIKCPTKIDTRLKALDTLNKMSGEYKTILGGNFEITYEEALKSVSGEDEY
ncbi:MAG: terminase small subunit [Bacilli bacterium]